MPSTNSFYSFTDGNGVEVIVQRLADVPEQYREQAKHIDLSKPAIPLPASLGGNAQTTPLDALGSHGKGAFLNVPSFIIGTGTGLALGLVGALVFRRASRLVSLVLAVLAVTALAVGYLTYVRRQVRLPGSGMATPGTLLDDARAAAGALNKRNLEQDRALNDIDKQR
jgi:hypothetical protein